MFSCRDAMHMMTEECDGALEGWPGVWYRIHIHVCPYCRRCKRQFEEAIALSKEIPPPVISSDLEEAALAAFRSRGKR
jgi:hypothetical protein